MTVTVETIGNGFSYDSALMEAKKRASRKCEILLDNMKKGEEVRQTVTCVNMVCGEWKIELVTELEVEPYDEKGTDFGNTLQKMGI